MPVLCACLTAACVPILCRFGRVDESRRRLQLALYIDSLLQTERQARQQAQALLKALYM